MKKNENSTKQKFYRIKAESLSTLTKSSMNLDKPAQKINDFELYLIQEGVKQLLFAQGNKQTTEVMGKDSTGFFNIYHQCIPKEMIQFLLDYNMIEEFEYTIEDYKIN